MGLPHKDPSGHPVWPRDLPFWSKPMPLRQYPTGRVNQEGQAAGCYWAHTPFSTSDFLGWENSNPLYRDNPQKMADLVTYTSATHHLNWADVQAPLDILLTADEQWLVMSRANEEVQHLHHEDPNTTPNPAEAVPLMEPNWNPNGGGPTLPETLQKVCTRRA